MDPRQSKSEKIERIKMLIPRSDAVKMNVQFPVENWAGILTDLDEEKIDDLLLILEEEAGMIADVEAERLRKQEINKTSYLQRMEKIRVAAETSDDNFPEA